MKDKKISLMRVLGNICFYFLIFLMVIYCISLLIPFVWMISTSFKGNVEYLIDAFRFPKHWEFSNYVNVWSKLKVELSETRTYDIFSMFGTSLLWSAGNSLWSIFLTTMVAYLLSKYKFKGREFIYMLGIFVMITPIVGNLPSAMAIRKALGIYDNIFLMILTNPVAVFSGLHFMILYGAFKGLSWSYAEAVFIDGGGHFRVFFSIMLPMILPTSAVLFVLNFIGMWNDYMTFLIWLPSYANLAVGMYFFQNEASIYESTVPEILAGFVIVIIPTAIMYLCSQNLIMAKFTVGGLKG